MAGRESFHPPPSFLDRLLSRAENGIYLAIGGLLIVAAATLLVKAVMEYARVFGSDDVSREALRMLDKLLLVLMMVELLHTVRVSLRAHSLLSEPFLIVGLIAGMRRILVITAEAWHPSGSDLEHFDRAMVELGLLTVLTIVLVVAIILLRRSDALPGTSELLAEGQKQP